MHGINEKVNTLSRFCFNHMALWLRKYSDASGYDVSGAKKCIYIFTVLYPVFESSFFKTLATSCFAPMLFV